jgi:hypothetical protein
MRILPIDRSRSRTAARRHGRNGVRIRPGVGVAVALPACLLAFAATAADEFTQHAAHEHGKATLDVALDGGRLEVRLSTPAINVLGFERAPRTDAEKQAAADASALLARHRELFSFPVAARCTANRPEVTAPAWAGGDKAGKGDKASKASDHDHGHDDGGHDHADYVATWTFDCATPAALAFFDAPLVGRLQPGTTVQANVISATLQTRQDLSATAVRIRLK